MSRVVVAGGAGFLGSHLCDRLLDRGDEVVCVDNLLTGQRSNIGHLIDEKAFELVVADVTGPLRLEGPVDAVCHLASPASPPAYLRLPLETLAAGSQGTRNLLELAERHSARFLLASTSEIYGDPLVHPQPETYRGNVETTGPRAVYDEAKRFAETLSMAMGRSRGVDVGIARIFNTYGPRLDPDDGRVVSNFMVQALGGRPLTVYGDGSQTRSLCFVDDQVGGLVALLDARGVTGPVNIGNPDERRVLEIAEEIRRSCRSGSEIVFEPLPEGDPRRRCPDIERARRLLGWEPRVPLDEGLARTVTWFAEVAGTADGTSPSRPGGEG